MKFHIYLYSCVLVFLLFSGGVAQQNVTSATLSGRIEDSSGAVISGANVTTIHLETNQQHTATSNDEGRYRFPYLRIGAYDIKVDAQGFSTITKQLTISVGQALDVPIRLDVAGVQAKVNI